MRELRIFLLWENVGGGPGEKNKGKRAKGEKGKERNKANKAFFAFSPLPLLTL
jgi:hypothetical protein